MTIPRVIPSDYPFVILSDSEGSRDFSMITPKLTPAQRTQAEGVFARLKAELLALSNGDDDTLFNFRRFVYKELMYDERGTPLARQRLKKATWIAQNKTCAVCGADLPLEGAEIERLEIPKGFVEGNVKVVHHECAHQLPTTNYKLQTYV